MSLSADAIDRIVANVLSQISPQHSAAPAAAVMPAAPSVKVVPVPMGSVSISEKVITAGQVEGITAGSALHVQERAIVTPAAWDVIKSRQLKVERGLQAAVPAVSGSQAGAQLNAAVSQPLLIVVKNVPALDQLWSTISGGWVREWQGCPDDAAKLAISEICRGSTQTVVIAAEQTHRAACLSNRHERVKAVAVQNAGDVKEVRRQLRANVWCINPQGRSFFEFKNLIQQIGQKS